MDFSLAWNKLQEMANSLIVALPNVIIGVLVFALFLLAARGIKALVQRLAERRRRARNLAFVLGRLAQTAVAIVGVLVAVTIIFPSFTPANLIGALGVSSIAIGFAFRDIFQNFLAGILILLTEPFSIDDQIVFKGYEGTVEDIQTRATTIRTYDGRRVVIPNAELFTSSVTVNTAFERRRLQYDVGIGYGDDIGRAKELILRAIRSVDGVLAEPPPDALVVELAPSDVTIRARWWITPPRRADALDLQDRVLAAIKTTLIAHGIDLPFPTQQILFHDQTEETDGDRGRQREGWPAGSGDPPRSLKIAGVLSQVRSLSNGTQGEARQSNKQ